MRRSWTQDGRGTIIRVVSTLMILLWPLAAT
jgi:hypothetical protein